VNVEIAGTVLRRIHGDESTVNVGPPHETERAAGEQHEYY
jgi:hypothetical protein